MQNLLTMSILEEVVENKPMTCEVIEGELILGEYDED